MSLAERIRTDLNAALKSRELVHANALRMLIAAMKNAEIEKGGALTEEDCLSQVQKAVKIRREAIEGAIKAKRDDLRSKEEAELKMLSAYLPAQLSEEELQALVAQTVQETGAVGPADTGKVMKALMPKIAGKADGGRASNLVRQKLSPDGRGG